MPDIADIHARQNADIDSVVGLFETRLRRLVGRAEADVVARLSAGLTIDKNGLIARTAANSKLLRRIDSLFLQAMKDQGYEGLVNAFVNQFPSQLPYFQETLKALSDQMEEPLGKVTFSATDKSAFATLQGNVAESIKAAVQAQAQAAVQQAMFNFAGVKFKDLIVLLKDKLDVSVAQAKTLADTGVTTFYRTVNDRGYQIVEKENPSFTFKYKYFGPLDLKNRPWCRKMEVSAKAGDTYTRDEIDGMDNGMTAIGSVFTMCGGWNCRHVWLLAPIGRGSIAKAA